jgi:hypothetical protein
MVVVATGSAETTKSLVGLDDVVQRQLQHDGIRRERRGAFERLGRRRCRRGSA